MSRKLIIDMLRNLKAILGIANDVKIMLRPLKAKAASISLRRKVIRLNNHIVPRISKEALKYLILHELAHLKLGSTSHTKSFYELVYSVLGEEAVKVHEKEILTSLIELNRERVRREGEQLGIDLF